MDTILMPDDHEDNIAHYTLSGVKLSALNEVGIIQHSTATAFHELAAEPLSPDRFSIDHAVFFGRDADGKPVDVKVAQENNDLKLSCGCNQPKHRLCTHMSSALVQLITNQNFRLFFDDTARHERIRKFAADYGLANVSNPDNYFSITLTDGKVVIAPKNRSLIPVTPASLSAFEQQLMVAQSPPQPDGPGDEQRRIIVLKPHKFYKHLVIDMYDAPVTKDGRVKNPLTPVMPLAQLLRLNDPSELKFYTSVARFQQGVEVKPEKADLEALKAVVKNPLNLDCYLQSGENASASALKLVKLRTLQQSIVLTVEKHNDFYEVSGELYIGEERFQLKDLQTAFGYFIVVDTTFYTLKDLQMMGAVNLFKQGKENLLIHSSQFAEFRNRILKKLEGTLTVHYPYIPQGTAQQIEEQRFGQNERIIYLSDFGQYVMIFPVMRYGEAEIPVRTNEQIYAVDNKGGEFLVKRNEQAEREFIALLVKQHMYFEEQLSDQLQYFYLHKKRFLDEDWFLNAFEVWRDNGITILGFSEISKINPEKVNITIRVLSGLNWFNTKIEAKWGKRKASMKHLHKAIRNKTKYVQLDDGTLGILPQEWVDKFTKFFEAAEVVDDELRTPKTNYATIQELYEDRMLDDTVRLEIEQYRQMLDNFERIAEVPVPEGLLTQLRPYQQQGLNWLNFLDDLNFGGCLADDMGLGKTIQILAFVLHQQTKVAHNTNLLVVPTSLIFNWQAEVEKFAPSIRILTIHGSDRVRNTTTFNDYELIITSYGTLLSDINFLKDYRFNYVFLDESQNIKNPGSQRYKAARLLNARNRICITGTPFENSSFDLYGQLSFACPGLLGSLQYFKEIYAVPIDQFKVSKRSVELQQKIKPFILRRTKQEVEKELPEKTEMILYCPMEDEQRRMYDAYEKEFRDFIGATSQDELAKRSMYVLKGITKLRQICDSPELIEGMRLPGNASSKLATLVDQIEGKAANHKILVFSQFVGMLNLVRRELEQRNIGFSYLTGATRNRGQVVNEFQDELVKRVFLISLKAGGTGLNLTAADYVYLVDPWWNPATENQAIDRIYRIGQQRHVVAVRLICPDTIEEKVVCLQQTKKELAGRLLSSDDIFRSLSKDDLLSLLAGP